VRGAAIALLPAALLAHAGACARAPEPPPGREVRFEELEMSLRLPEGWRAEDAYALYARQRQIPESEARALPLMEVVRRVRALLVARPPEGSGASPLCMLSIEVEDLSAYPGVNDVSAYAELAERAGRRRLSGYERLRDDVRTSAGAAPAVRRECRAVAPFGADPPAVRNLTLFLKKDNLGIAVAGYEVEAQFEPRRADFDSILGSVRVGKEHALPLWERLLRWLSGRD
jgi:hypothetical protein